jgi:UDP-N-acetyl-D-galactosamine dehydrogenase
MNISLSAAPASADWPKRYEKAMYLQKKRKLSMPRKEKTFMSVRIAIIGLGYVGLPLAVEFSRKYKTVGFDINRERVIELCACIDKTGESNIDEMKVMLNQVSKSSGLKFTSNLKDISECNIFIVTVPTPIDHFRAPDLRLLLSATAMIGSILKKQDIVIFESTVYPGCTEEDCVPVLEKQSGLTFNKDFFCGYSPERINPGDKVNTLTKIKKVTSGSTIKIAEIIDNLYASIISAGTHKAPSIKVAEASKAIENAQRDLNISFVNELALIFDRIGIDTSDVIEAAGTKWNFLKFHPGLVGGHCIGVDPYYLAHKAISLGYDPQVILSGRRVNDYMGEFIANKVVKLMIANDLLVKGSEVLILGVTFKENCPDIRNSKVVDIYNELQKYGVIVKVYDPYANAEEVKKEYKIILSDTLSKYAAIVIAVSHKEFYDLDIKKMTMTEKSVIYDVKGILPKTKNIFRL